MVKKTLFNDLKQILWALFLVYIILAVMGYLFGRQIGYRDAYAVCAAIAALVTASFIFIYLLNIAWIALEGRKEKHLPSGKRKQDH